MFGDFGINIPRAVFGGACAPYVRNCSVRLIRIIIRAIAQMDTALMNLAQDIMF
jgi:hypothetical protein